MTELLKYMHSPFKIIVIVTISILLILSQLSPRTVHATIPYVNELISIDGAGSEIPSFSQMSASKDGRYVVFRALSALHGDTDGDTDVYLKDTVTGTLQLISLQLDVPLGDVKISAGGRYVAYSVGTAYSGMRVYLYDISNSTTTHVSVPLSGTWPGGSVNSLDISADGRYVVFGSDSSYLVAGDTNGKHDVFVRDMSESTTTLLSKSEGGALSNDNSTQVSMSCDGGKVAFISMAKNLTSDTSSNGADLFLVNRIGGHEISNLTFSTNGGAYAAYDTSFSCDASTIAFVSAASDIVPNDTNGARDVFVYDVLMSEFKRVSVATGGGESDLGAPGSSSVSSDGRYVAFSSPGTNIVNNDTNNRTDIFVHDRREQTTQRINMANATSQSPSNTSDPFMLYDGTGVLYRTTWNGIASGLNPSTGSWIILSKTGLDACTI